MNPYSGVTFFEFFAVLFSRIARLFTQDTVTLVSDEVQLLALIGVALSASVLGGILYMKKMTMAAGALSHTVLLGIVVAFLALKAMSGALFVSVYSLPTLLIGGLIAAVITLFLNEVLHKKLGVEKGASVGLVFTTLFALSLVLVSIYLKNTHIGLDSIMGNIDGVHRDDLKPIYVLAVVNACFIILFFRPLMMDAFDPMFASLVGVRNKIIVPVTLILLALSATVFFKAIGVFLFLAFLVIPIFIARAWTHNLKFLLLFATVISCVGSIIGVALSRHFLSYYQLPLSSSALVALVVACLGALLLGLKRFKTVVINRRKRYSLNKIWAHKP
ncbi:hypothetical protein COB21_05060 [Candidatus Aerophobetes bacterium]|uniref:Metal ABC transporter permease n=1 Tax=Aerophobetes bacterium TaxID=2030807 RepID=A0A2A4X0D6_UNCAE|nr:MAG: hypothetical protein COB21_05060 [Candidatus Aerophobetes bacterium]